MTRIYAALGGAALLLLVAWGAYRWIDGRAADRAWGECRADYEPRVTTLTTERDDARLELSVMRAQAEARARAIDAATEQLEQERSANAQRVRVLESASAGARRELRRLHDALATARVSADSILRSGVSSPGPVADGRAAGTGELLGECASRLVEVGGHADRLAAQVIGLQAYARLAQRACQ